MHHDSRSVFDRLPRERSELVELKYDSRSNPPPRDRVRELGFDPDHLTQQEQVELLTLDRQMAQAGESQDRAGERQS